MRRESAQKDYEKNCRYHRLLISRVVYIENEDLNLDREALGTAQADWAYLRASFGISGKAGPDTESGYFIDGSSTTTMYVRTL